MKNIFIQVALISLFCFESYAQNNPQLLAPLPTVLNESSGIEVNGFNNIWTHNDSGDFGRIFKVDTLGNLIRTLYLLVDTAIDIEEMTQDANGNYYIGDLGNNLNDRIDLCIYKIPNPDSIVGDTVVPEVIFFHYPDQLMFPPDSAHNNFDCEAMFHYGDSLYIFSKNRGLSTYSRMYSLPDQPGHYSAILVDSFNTVNWVASADISPSGKNMVLLSETRIWLFTNYSGTDFFGGTAQQINMNFSQKEGIVFVNDSLVYLTDEKLLTLGGNLYKMDLRSWINSVAEQINRDSVFQFFPNPACSQLNIHTRDNIQLLQCKIYDILGKLMLTTTATSVIDISLLPAGMYLLNIEQGEKNFSGKFIKK